jgi:hypothetical protein
MEERLPALIKESLSMLPSMLVHTTTQFERYKQTDLTNAEADSILVNLYRQGCFTNSQLTTAITEVDTPKHEEHAEDGMTAWRIFNAATEALKLAPNMVALNKSSERVSHYFDNHVCP